MKSLLAYCIFVLRASEAAEVEQVNKPVDPDGEVQLFNKQTRDIFYYSFTNTL